MNRQVQVILREDVSRLGQAGDVVAVRPGYARNYLLPMGMATLATASKLAEVEHQRRVITAKVTKELKDLNAVKHKIQSLVLEASAQAGEEGRLFGSITSQNIADLLAEKGIEIDRRKIALDDSIKQLGEHEVQVKLHRDLSATVKLVVTAAG
jgi:large subunit ribosomal protein L9